MEMLEIIAKMAIKLGLIAIIVGGLIAVKPLITRDKPEKIGFVIVTIGMLMFLGSLAWKYFNIP